MRQYKTAYNMAKYKTAYNMQEINNKKVDFRQLQYIKYMVNLLYRVKVNGRKYDYHKQTEQRFYCYHLRQV